MNICHHSLDCFKISGLHPHEYMIIEGIWPTPISKVLVPHLYPHGLCRQLHARQLPVHQDRRRIHHRGNAC